MRYEFKPLNLRPEWEWIVERVHCSYCEDTKGIVAYKDGKIVACIALDNWVPNSVCVHIVVEDVYVFRHGFAEECFEYIFNTCERGVLIGITPADNLRALKFNRHVGLEEVYRIKDGCKVGVDFVIQELRKENCKYLRKDNHETIRSVAA